MWWAWIAACVVAQKVELDVSSPEVVDSDPPVVEAVDSDVPVETADTAPPPEESDPPEDDGWTRRIDVRITADDEWRLWIDGVEYTGPNQYAWTLNDKITVEARGRRHVIAVSARDTARVITGVLHATWVSTELYALSGDEKWRVTDAPPPDDLWLYDGYDDSTWGPLTPCPPEEAATWGTYWNADLLATGAQWAWTGSCRGLGARWMRLVIE